jgi:hypothetical protein
MRNSTRNDECGGGHTIVAVIVTIIVAVIVTFVVLAVVLAIVLLELSASIRALVSLFTLHPSHGRCSYTCRQAVPKTLKQGREGQ